MPRTFPLSAFTGGWFIGDFTPTLVPSTDFEVCVKRYRAGQRDVRHFHKHAFEYTVIISGTVTFNGVEYEAGQIVELQPGEASEFSAVTDAVLTVVKVPSVKGDKHAVDLTGERGRVNIVVPMAGRGSRFVNAGYELPKPLIRVHGKPMIDVVINNVRPKRRPYRFIFLVLDEHIHRYGIDKHLLSIEPDAIIIPVKTVTEGAACTVLLAKEHINNEEHLMTVNSDQWVDADIDEYLDQVDRHAADGVIMTLKSRDPKWSFVGFDRRGAVTSVLEKIPVSDEATVGFYNFARGSDFVEAAERMIAKGMKMNGEYYIAPTYNELIHDGKKLVVYNVGGEMDGMYGLGIPSDLEAFLAHPVSRRATDF